MDITSNHPLYLYGIVCCHLFSLYNCQNTVTLCTHRTAEGRVYSALNLVLVLLECHNNNFCPCLYLPKTTKDVFSKNNKSCHWLVYEMNNKLNSSDRLIGFPFSLLSLFLHHSSSSPSSSSSSSGTQSCLCFQSFQSRHSLCHSLVASCPYIEKNSSSWSMSLRTRLKLGLKERNNCV